MERPDYSQSNIALAIAAMEAELSHDDAQVPAPMRAAWTVIKGALEEARPLLRPPAADAPAGTLAAALARIDQAISALGAGAVTAPPGDVERAYMHLADSWPTVRAAAIRSLEPPSPPAASKAPVAERARTFAATTLDAMHRVAGQPGPDAAAAVQIQAAMAQVVLGGLQVEALSAIMARLEDIGNALEGGDYPSIARSLADIARGG